MRCVAFAKSLRGFCAILALLTEIVCAAAAVPEVPDSPRPPELLTNLFQLRHWAEQASGVVHPFRVVAEVVDADPACDVVALRDDSGVEFIRLDFQDRGVEPGATVCLEGRGCALKPRGFGLAVVPRMVVDNDGAHGTRTESGTVFLQAGMNPIRLQWFNGIGDFSLSVEYEGPNLPRQPVPSSILSRAMIDAATATTHFLAGLDFRCYEGAWESLPDFAQLRPARSGIATNFVLEVRTRKEAVGLEFDGFIRIPRDGAYTFHVASDDGSRLFVGESSVKIRVLSSGPAPRAIERVPATVLERDSRPWAALEGTVHFVGTRGVGGELQMRVGSDDIRVEILESGDAVPSLPLRTKVRVSGIYRDLITEDGSRAPGLLMVSSWKAVCPATNAETRLSEAIGSGETTRLSAVETASATITTPAVTTVAEIKALPPELASQRSTVTIRGVVTATSPGSRSAVVQDSTRGIYVYLQDLNKLAQLNRGDFCQIDGVTSPGQFAPLIEARRITHLGAGQLPEPLRATWDQLMNGSLDTQYVEMDGVVTAVHDEQVVLFTEGGKITLWLSDFRPAALAGYENALVRIRGCVFTPFNRQTRQIEAGPLRVRGAAIHILQPAPGDVFDVPQKSIGELLLYDPKAAPFRMLKVNGQIVHSRPGEHFLADGTNGMRVATRNSDLTEAGELVDAVGFLDLAGPVAELKEAIVRRTSRAPLPAPVKLAPDQLLQASHAGTLVRLEGTLMNQWRGGTEPLLELQSGFLAFRARIHSGGQSVRLPPAGSRLELTGVYAPQGNRRGDRTVTGFELLMHSPADIRVLATPPWWTLTRLLILAAALATLLGAVLAWNNQLRRQVQERSRKLEAEIANRRRVELQHAAEAERSRIARDLHDELGAGLTEVSLLASAGLGESRSNEKKDDRFNVIAEKARALVSGLDVIVWAVDPKRDSLQSFADYLGSYTKELLSASGISCRLRIPIECDAVALPGPARHELFLAFKEALNNIVRHASATEVELQMNQSDHRLEIVIADNGRGFDLNSVRRGNGLTNLYERLEALNGQCHVEARPGKGTTVKLTVPLLHDSSSQVRGQERPETA